MALLLLTASATPELRITKAHAGNGDHYDNLQSKLVLAFYVQTYTTARVRGGYSNAYYYMRHLPASAGWWILIGRCVAEPSNEEIPVFEILARL